MPSGVSFSSQSGEVFNKLSDAFMRPAVWAVEYLLENEVHVNVYSGQIDIIVDALCTEQWINNMTWSGMSAWKAAQEQDLVIDGIPQGIYRNYENFSFFKIFRAGHMVVSTCRWFCKLAHCFSLISIKSLTTTDRLHLK